MRVTVEFLCDLCKWHDLRTVEHTVWRVECPECGAQARRLIQVHTLFPRVQHDLHDWRALNESVEPDDRVIDAVHFYNYGEYPSKSERKQIKKHRLMHW